jgi:hypothetical protein
MIVVKLYVKITAPMNKRFPSNMVFVKIDVYVTWVIKEMIALKKSNVLIIVLIYHMDNAFQMESVNATQNIKD